MNYANGSRNKRQALFGLGAVVALHVALIYALMNGLDTSTSFRAPPPPMLTRLVAAPPPPPVPPALPAPDLAAPAPFVPRVEAPVAPPPTVPAPTARFSGFPVRAANAPAAAAHDTHFNPSAILGGARAPTYPDAYEADARSGRVTVLCMIEATGIPTHCRVVSATGGPAFAAETLRWLTAPGHPVYRPATLNGVPKGEAHEWVVQFDPPAAEDGR